MDFSRSTSAQKAPLEKKYINIKRRKPIVYKHLYSD